MEAQRSGPLGMEPGRALSGPRLPMPTPGWFLRPGHSAVSRRWTALASSFDMAARTPKGTATGFLVGSPSFSFQSHQHDRLTRGTGSSVATGQPIIDCHRSFSLRRRARPRAGLMVAADGFGGFAPWLQLCSPFHPACSTRDGPSHWRAERSCRARAEACPSRALHCPAVSPPHAVRRRARLRPAAWACLPQFLPVCGWGVATRRMRRAHPQHAPPSRRRLPDGHAIGWGGGGGSCRGAHAAPPFSVRSGRR